MQTLWFGELAVSHGIIEGGIFSCGLFKRTFFAVEWHLGCPSLHSCIFGWAAICCAAALGRCLCKEENFRWGNAEPLALRCKWGSFSAHTEIESWKTVYSNAGLWKQGGWLGIRAVGVGEVRKHQEREYLTALTDTSDREGVRGRENQDWMGEILSCLFFEGVGSSWSLIGE